MTSYIRLIVAFAAALLWGCANRSIDPREQHSALTKDLAIVLVGIDSDVLLGAVSPPCTSAPCLKPVYSLNGRRDILAFPVDVGIGFNLDRITTYDSREAKLKGKELKIERHGIYYYGTIKADRYQVGIEHGADPYFLLAAKRKFSTRFDELEPVNFAWPPASDEKVGFGYQIATSTQAALSSYGPRRLHLAAVAPSPKPLNNCRSVHKTSLPDFLVHEEYIKRAFNTELDASRMYGVEPGSIAIKGAITELSFNSDLGRAFWQIGLRLEAPDGRSFTVSQSVPFKISWQGIPACFVDVGEAFPGAVQKLIESVVTAPEFRAILSAPRPPQ